MTKNVTLAEQPWAPAIYEENRFGARGREANLEADPSDLDFAALVKIVSEWRWLILSLVAVGVALAVIVTLLSTPLYRSQATLEANPPSVEILNEKMGASPPTQNSLDFIATQVGLLGSRSLAERVVQDLNLAANRDFVDPSLDAAARLKAATEKVARGLHVVAPESGQLIKIEYVSDSPALAAQVVNGVTDSFIRSNLERRYESSAYARTFLERQIAKSRADLERSERQLVGYAQAQGIINTGGSGEDGKAGGDVNSLQGASLVALNSALAEATARRISAEGAFREARASGATAEVNTSTQGMRQSKAALEAEYQDKRTLMKADHPDMLSLRSRIDELNRQISIETSKVTGGRLNSLLADFQAAASAERALQGKVSGLKGAVLNLRGRSIQYTILQREVDTNRALYDALLQRYKEVGLAGGVGNNTISVVDRGDVPGEPYKPNLLFNLLVGLALGLLGGIAVAIVLEFINDTIRTREDVRQKLKLACLGSVPKRTGKGSFVADLKNYNSAVSEAYSAVLGSLRFSTGTGAPKTLLISSTRSGEGKSSTALALAQNFARLGQRTLLIDSDLRKPTFKAPNNQQGLTHLLTTDDAVSDHIAGTQYENLWLIPCGAIPPNPADLLSTARFMEILNEAAEHFDHIVIDGPPVLGLADSPLLATVCTGTLMVVEAGKTRAPAVVAAIRRLELAGAHMVGAVLTKSSEVNSAYDYGYSSYSYKVGKEDYKILMSPHQAED